MKGKVVLAVLMTVELIALPTAYGDLIGHWTFDTDATASVGADGTFKNAAGISTTAIAGAGSLDLTDAADENSYVRMDGGDGVTNDGNGFVGIAGGADRTLSMWVKGGAQTGGAFFAGWGNMGGGSRVRYDLGVQSGTLDQYRNELNAGAITSSTGTTFLDDAWHHAVITLDAGTTTFYLDGVAYGSTTSTVSTVADQDMVIGTGIREAGNQETLPGLVGGGGDRYFDGLIDDVQVYDEALSLGQIGSLFSNPGSIIAILPLTLQIDDVTGGVKLINNTGADVDLDLYKITSPAGSLLADNSSWSSLQDQNLVGFPAGDGSGNGWEETGGSGAMLLGEAYLQASSVLTNGGEVGLGQAYDINNTDTGIQLQYHDVFADKTFTSDAVFVSSVLGDMNGDGLINTDDVDPFVQALTDRAAYDAQPFAVAYPEIIGDVNGDGAFNMGDINAFAAAVVAPGTASATSVPEPSSLVLLGLGLVALIVDRRRK